MKFPYDDPQMTFHGTAGVLRRFDDGHREMALFHGAQIGDDQLTLAVSDPDLGVSAAYTKLDALAGQSDGGGTLTLTFKGASPLPPPPSSWTARASPPR